MELTHLNSQGRGRMVDVSAKDDTKKCPLAKEIYVGRWNEYLVVFYPLSIII